MAKGQVRGNKETRKPKKEVKKTIAAKPSTKGTVVQDSMAEHFVRHRQPWKSEEVAKLKTLALKGMGLKAIAKALTRSEESVQDRAKIDGIKIAKLR